MFAVSFLIAFPVAIVKTVFKRYDHGGPMQTCFGTEYETAKAKTIWEDISFFWCSSENLALNEEWGYIHIVSLKTICVISHGLYNIMCCNLPEAFFYYKIFKRIKRLENKIRF